MLLSGCRDGFSRAPPWPRATESSPSPSIGSPGRKCAGSSSFPGKRTQPGPGSAASAAGNSGWTATRSSRPKFGPCGTEGDPPMVVASDRRQDAWRRPRPIAARRHRVGDRPAVSSRGEAHRHEPRTGDHGILVPGRRHFLCHESRALRTGPGLAADPRSWRTAQRFRFRSSSRRGN